MQAELDPKGPETNLLDEANWSFTPGVTSENGTLTVAHTGLALRKEQGAWADPDTPEYFPVTPGNPWTHVEMSQADGNVGVRARLSDISGRASLQVLSGPTLRYDERIYQQAGMGVTVEGSVITANLWYGTGEQPDETEAIDLGTPIDAVELRLEQTAGGLVVHVNDDQKIEFPEAKVFESGQLWFGMDAAKQWNVVELTAYPLGENELEVVDSAQVNLGELDPNGLQATVARVRPDLVISTAIDLTAFTYDQNYARLVTANAGGLVPEMLAKPQAWQPESNARVWSELDAFVDLGRRHGKQLHYHTTVFGEANPAWKEAALTTASPEEARAIMRADIQEPLTRYRGQFATVDVVNEPFDEDDWSKFRPNLWYNAMGEGYISEAFRAAHEADPNALLFLNDWGLEHDPDRWDALIRLLTDLQAEGVPVHGIGFQAHLDSDDINELLGSDILAERFKQLEDMGLKVRVSELSIEGADPDQQAQMAEKIVRTALGAKNCISVNFWGLASNEFYFTSEPDDRYSIPPPQYGNDAPWQKNEDGSYSPKPAAEALFAAASN